MILELLDVPVGQVCVIVDLLTEHFSEMLVGCLVFASDKFLRELVHEVCGHTYHFCLVELILDLREVLRMVLTNVSLQVLVLTFQHHVDRCVEGFAPPILLIELLMLRELVTLLDLSFLLQYSTQHLLLVEICLH